MRIVGAWCKELIKPSELRRIQTEDWTDLVKNLAENFEPGVFTTMRLKNGKGAGVLEVVGLDLHLDRLAANKIGIDKNILREEVSSFVDLIGGTVEEELLALVVIVAPMDSLPSIGFGLKTIIPPPESCSVLLEWFGGREDPSVKSTEWIQQRDQMKQLTNAEFNEVLLVKPDGRILEGLSSNFGLIDEEGRLVTAPDTDVLPGTVMRMVKEAAREIGIPIVERCATLDDVKACKGAFLTSTSRLLLPVERLKGLGRDIGLSSLDCPELVQLRDLLANHI